jgi:hypothetical protein
VYETETVCNVREAPSGTAKGRFHCILTRQQRNTETHSPNICNRGEVSVTYSERVFVALVIQYAMRMRRIILSSMACLVLLYFSTFSYKCLDFRKEND